jgi:hypothetical protein
LVGWKPSAHVSSELKRECNRSPTLCHRVDIALDPSGLVGRATLNSETL